MPLTFEADDYCPLLTCWAIGAHTHPVCDDCGAVNYGNVSCPTCRAERPAVDAQILQNLADLGLGSPLEKTA